MSGGLVLEPNVSLAAIAATATSIRLHGSQPTTYAGAVASAIGIKSFAAGTLFAFVGESLVAQNVSGSVLGWGAVTCFSIANECRCLRTATLTLANQNGA